jgi:hypothetical protein
MKTKLLALILIFTLTGFSFAQESTENPKSNIKTPEELQQEVLKNKNSKNDEFEEFEFPEETEPVRFLIKADILSPIFGLSVSALTGFNSEDTFTEITRTPIYWEFFLEKRLGIILSVESLNAIYFPTAVGILGGVSYYPFGTSPDGLFVKALAGGTLGMVYNLALQTGVGYQIVTKDKFVMSFGADFAFYPTGNTPFFWIPSASASLGWAF